MSCNERGREVGPLLSFVYLMSSPPPSFSCIAASQPPVRPSVRPSVRRDWEREPQSKVFRALFSRSHCSLDRQTSRSTLYSSFTTVLPPQEQKVSRYAFWGTDRSMIMLALTHVRVVALWLSHGSSWGTSLSRQSAFTPFCALHRLYIRMHASTAFLSLPPSLPPSLPRARPFFRSFDGVILSVIGL